MSLLNVNNTYHVQLKIENSTTKYIRDATNSEVDPEHVLHKFLTSMIDADWPYAGSVFSTIKASQCNNCGGRVYQKPIVGNIGVIKSIAKQMGFDVKVVVCSEEGCRNIYKDKLGPLLKEDRNLPFYWS